MEADKVVIGRGEAWISLRPYEKPGIGWTTWVEFQTSHLKGECETELWGVDEFSCDLERMHTALSGKATLGSLDGDCLVQIQMEGDSMGHIQTKVNIERRWGGPVEFDLNYTVDLDQSYLPEIIDGLRRHFPKASKQ